VRTCGSVFTDFLSRIIFSRQRGRPHRQDGNFLKIKLNKQISGHMPQMGYDTKTNRLTDCQSQCDFDLYIIRFYLYMPKWFYFGVMKYIVRRQRTLSFSLSLSLYIYTIYIHIHTYIRVHTQLEELSRCRDESRAERSGFDCRQRQHFSFLRDVQIGSGIHPASCPVGTGGNFLGVKAAGTWCWSLTYM
jgi:hypothetical protein